MFEKSKFAILSCQTFPLYSTYILNVSSPLYSYTAKIFDIHEVITLVYVCEQTISESSWLT